MDNPYEVPASALTPVGSPWRATAHVVVTAVITFLCVMQFVGVCISVGIQLDAGETAADGASIRALPLAVLMIMPLSLALGGIFLACGRTVSGLFFAAYLIQYLLKANAEGGFNLYPVVTGLFFLGYAVWRWNTGHLKGWPGGTAFADDAEAPPAH